MQTGNSAAALTTLEKLVVLHGDRVASYSALATAYFRVSSFQRALEVLNTRPEFSADLDTERGIVLHKLDRVREAEMAYRRSLARNPMDQRATANLAFALRDLGNWDEAANMSRRALELDPTDARSLNNLAEWHHVEGRLKEAVQYYTLALRAQPRDPDMWRGLANLEMERAGLARHARRGAYRKAKRALAESLHLRLPSPTTRCR